MQLSPKSYKKSPSKDTGTSSSRPSRPISDPPTIANWSSEHLTIACGIAIFHVASARVVLCYHTRDRYWFLPKGRKDADEPHAQAACREGFEESGYRNRLLPIPMKHRQPIPHGPERDAGTLERWRFVAEPVWCQLVPVSSNAQYMLFWYVGETVPPAVEEEMSGGKGKEQDVAGAAAQAEGVKGGKTLVHATYVQPEPYPFGLTIEERIKMEPEGYEPVRHQNTGVDEEEALYDSRLVPVGEALEKLRGSIMADVVRRGWDGICARKEFEGIRGLRAERQS